MDYSDTILLASIQIPQWKFMRSETSGATVITNVEGSSLEMFYVFRFLLSSKPNFFHFKTLFIHILVLGL
jgi:hypothetical protein